MMRGMQVNNSYIWTTCDEAFVLISKYITIYNIIQINIEFLNQNMNRFYKKWKVVSLTSVNRFALKIRQK